MDVCVMSRACHVWHVIVEKTLELKIVLDHLPNPNANPNRRSGYAKNKKGGIYNPKLSEAKKVDREEIKILVSQSGWDRPPMQKAHITITWRSSDKRNRDIDNLLAAMKGTIDGLVVERVIFDDSAKHLSYTLYYEWGDEVETDETILEIKEIRE